MYPLYWTTSKEGIYLRFSYDFKKKCVEMYRSGVYLDTPDGISQKCFRSKVRQWARMEDALGPEALKPRHVYKKWTSEEKYELVCQVLAGKSYLEVSLVNGLKDSVLRNWVRKYNDLGYNGLVANRRGRPRKNPCMKKVNYNSPRKIKETEYEELVRLRAENEYIKAEIEVIKKEIALREEKEAAQLKAKKQRSSKNSDPKDSN